MITSPRIEQLIINSISLVPPHGLLCIFLLESNKPMIEFHYPQGLLVFRGNLGKYGNIDIKIKMLSRVFKKMCFVGTHGRQF